MISVKLFKLLVHYIGFCTVQQYCMQITLANSHWQYSFSPYMRVLFLFLWLNIFWSFLFSFWTPLLQTKLRTMWGRKKEINNKIEHRNQEYLWCALVTRTNLHSSDHPFTHSARKSHLLAAIITLNLTCKPVQQISTHLYIWHAFPLCHSPN